LTWPGNGTYRAKLRDGGRKLVRVQHGRATVNRSPQGDRQVRHFVITTPHPHKGRTIPEGGTVTTIPAATPVVLPVSKAVVWLSVTVFLAFAVYYFIGIDQGATSVFGNNMYIHEFVHDARHFLGFPCH
jgi:Probable cobalt transporter subunit (CbtB)